ncbi:DNA polymerase III subunit alpha [Flammeovirgaceae bacterium SG7u.111]|nr:DNA polymerase III subunit alpha [Flammeovirgaceae bacterium SG7u.132]WPO33201.1 DNA polymerase III subunit alpha [Flammeovirgaceae bacterium SG7u.111]
MYLIFDTETTGLPKKWDAPHTDTDNWPRLVQLAYQLHDNKGGLIKAKNIIVKPEGFTIPFNAEKIHGISTKRAEEEGHPLEEVLKEFAEDLELADVIIGHNIVGYDIPLMGAEYVRKELPPTIMEKDKVDTMKDTTEFCELPGGRGRFKPPKLIELHKKLFGFEFADAHDAAYDVSANAKCFFELLKLKVVPTHDGTAPEEVVYEEPKLDSANFAKVDKTDGGDLEVVSTDELTEVIPFSHLHMHSQFSILQSTAAVKKVLAKAREMKMRAVAFTDHGNLHAAFNAVGGQGDDLKVIIGCEFNVAKEHTKTKFTKDNPDVRFNQVLIAKHQEGYKNLSKLSSLGYIEGFYSGMPRIGKELIIKYKEGLMAFSGNLFGEVPSLILNEGEHVAEEAFQWWHEQFGDDFYVELMRHGLPEEQRVNEVLIGFAKKYGVKLIASNDVYYLEKEDSHAHDVLWCIKEGKQMSMPTGNGRKARYCLPNDEYYFKSQEEMNAIFADIPEALHNVNEVVDKCSPLKLKRDILLPAFPMPEQFTDQNDFLRHLTYEGAKTRYEQPLSDDTKERIDFELKIIKQMGFPGYFLIVQDFIKAARDMGVSVGPGRGSAAGSVVAFCTGITNIDPIKYNLLFERFLNPERVSMPDIDIDFDDRGRQRVIDWVVEKYGKNQVAQIITYGTMAAKMSIKDVARALELELSEANALAKMVPDTPGTTLDKAFKENPDLDEIKKNDKGLKGEVMQLAHKLEGSVRGTGIHAAGVIIAPDDLLEYIPVCTSKDADLLVTQFDGKVVEDAGMLKMDFLGLKTLTIINDALVMIKKNHGIDIDPDLIPLDDEVAFGLYQRGETIGTFQFESPGMQKYLRELKPNNIEDLIAMNALYRPGPIQFIPNFIDRKHGKEEIEYPHDLLEPILNYSNGIMVYQEQIMQTAQIMAGFSLGKADILRRAMGKKKFDVMAEMKEVFVKGAKEIHGIDEEKSSEVFAIMEKFAAYGFNRSHSAAYSVVAYQTGYLKANYPAEYMASVMSHSMGTIDKISFFMEECRRMGVQVLGPDVNESIRDFSVNSDGDIRFGLAAIKGAGDSAVEAIIEEREENGKFENIWDFVERCNLRQVNKKTLESLAYAGAFDELDKLHRAQFFHIEDGEHSSGIEKLVKYGNSHQAEKTSSQISLFGGSGGMEMPKPKLPECNPWPDTLKLRHEKDVVGFYISGHPLDQYALELQNFCRSIRVLNDDLEKFQNQELAFGGIITDVMIREGRNGNKFAIFTVEDYDGSFRFPAFGSVYYDYSNLLQVGTYVYIKGKVQEKYKNPGMWDYRPSSIELLSEVKAKMCHKVKLSLDMSKIQPQTVTDICELATLNSGEVEMHVEVFDPEKSYKVNLFSRKYKVDPTTKFMNDIKNLEGVDFALN